MHGPIILVIFGATGDLTRKKLLPAIYNLVKAGEVMPPIFIVGVGRRKITTDQFAEMMAAAVRESVGNNFDERVWQKITEGIAYQEGFFEDRALYDELITVLEAFDKQMNACVPRFFYLATPPQHYEMILTHLNGSKLSEGCGQGTTLYTRVLIEKPFGKDLDTARHLDKLLASIFEEKQIYRIDHYLGKETIQNVLAFRFANGIFEPIWNNKFIDHVQITLSENEGIGSRGGFYDGVGALRDVVQNHMLQMLALTAMDQPRAFDATSIRDKRVEAMRSIICIEPKLVKTAVVRGQYEGYLREPKVDPSSTTETFVALKLMLNSPRWKGVPFYLRAGKMLARKVTEISLHYKKPALCISDSNLPEGQVCLFNEEKVLRNVLSIRIQPDEGIALRAMVKKPGLGMDLADRQMHFRYKESFPEAPQPEAYERLLLDALRGDQTLFARTDEIEASWQLVTKILDGWRDFSPTLQTYKSGSWGPKQSEELVKRDGRHWFLV